MKNRKKPLLIISGIILIVLVIIGITTQNKQSQIENEQKETIIADLNNTAQKYGFENIKIEIKSKNKDLDSYNVIISASNIEEIEYEVLAEANNEFESRYVNIESYSSNGNTYDVFDDCIFLNNYIVWQKPKAHICEECSDEGTHSCTNPFSGETEWYCSYHYGKMKDMYNSIGMDY